MSRRGKNPLARGGTRKEAPMGEANAEFDNEMPILSPQAKQNNGGRCLPRGRRSSLPRPRLNITPLFSKDFTRRAHSMSPVDDPVFRHRRVLSTPPGTVARSDFGAAGQDGGREKSAKVHDFPEQLVEPTEDLDEGEYNSDGEYDQYEQYYTVPNTYRGRSRPGFGRGRPRARGVPPAPRRSRDEGADRRKAPSYVTGVKRKRDEYEDYYDYRPQRASAYEYTDEYDFDGVSGQDEDFGDPDKDYYSYDTEGYGYEYDEYDEEFGDYEDDEHREDEFEDYEDVGGGDFCYKKGKADGDVFDRLAQCALKRKRHGFLDKPPPKIQRRIDIPLTSTPQEKVKIQAAAVAGGPGMTATDVTPVVLKVQDSDKDLETSRQRVLKLASATIEHVNERSEDLDSEYAEKIDVALRLVLWSICDLSVLILNCDTNDMNEIY